MAMTSFSLFDLVTLLQNEYSSHTFNFFLQYLLYYEAYALVDFSRKKRMIFFLLEQNSVWNLYAYKIISIVFGRAVDIPCAKTHHMHNLQ